VAGIWLALKILLPILVALGLFFIYRFAVRSVDQPQAEEKIRWYAGLILVLVILAIIGWIIIMVPSSAVNG
jgi:predicted PurR-regulated permease PerM